MGREMLLRSYIKWNWGWNLDSALRYQPLIPIIEERKPKVIVEIGSGSRGISAYTGVPSFGVDVAFNLGVEPGLQRRVYSSGDRLPFDDESVDVMLSVDMLEHVPAGLRPGIIQEMFRAIRSDGIVYVAVPCGKMSQAADQRVHEAFLKRKGKVHPMLRDHIEHGLPSKEEIVSLVEDVAILKGWAVRLYESSPIWLWEWNLTWFAVERWIPHLGHFQRLILQPLFPFIKRIRSKDNYRLILVAGKSIESLNASQ